MPDRSIPVALIGYGYVGKTFHAPLLQAVPGLELTLVGSSNPEKVWTDLPDIRVISDPQKAATHPDVELIVIATPNETHTPLATAALQAGKHVVVDKPFTLTVEEARQLADLAERKGRLLSVFHNRRWDSEFLGARAILQSGELGEIVHFESRMDRFRPEVRDRWRERPCPGAGIWYDLGPHLIDQSLQLFGLPRSVSAHFAKQRTGAQTEDWVHVLLDYGRMQAVLHASVLAAGATPRLIIHGTKGSWVKYGTDVQERQFQQGMQPHGENWGKDPQPGILFRADGSSTELAVPAGDYTQYYVGIQEALCGNGKNPVMPAEALAVMSILEAAIRSVREHSPWA